MLVSPLGEIDLAKNPRLAGADDPPVDRLPLSSDAGPEIAPAVIWYRVQPPRAASQKPDDRRCYRPLRAPSGRSTRSGAGTNDSLLTRLVPSATSKVRFPADPMSA